MAFNIEKHSQVQSKLMSIPLELRHKIYDQLNFRGRWEERQVLRDYLDRIDPQPNYNGNDDHDEQTFDEDGNTDLLAAIDDETEDELMSDTVEGDYDETFSNGGNEYDNDGLDDGNDAHDWDSEQAAQDIVGDAPTDQMRTGDAATATTTVSRIAPRPFNKYRHVPYLLHLSACPPQANVLQLCQRMYEEATCHFYDTNALHIDATKSFQHLTFFEETLETITEAAFSPLESITKVHLRIVWDSAYVNALATSAEPMDEDYERLLHLRGGLESSLFIRLNEVAKALRKSNKLRELTVQIFDSKNSPEEVVLQNELLEQLIMMCCEKDVKLKVVEHKLEASQRPKRKSVVGRFRAELKELVENAREIR